MPQLILLNGPPGCGKSTLARMYADDHPLTLNLDIDHVAVLIGGWTANRHTAGLLARAIALAAARTHLASGHDVVIPQFLEETDFIEQVEQVARDAGAEFHEIALTDVKENAIQRYVKRPSDSTRLPVGAEDLAHMYDLLMSVIAARPGTKLVPSIDGEPEDAYRAFLATLTP
jgi:predicted kinase